MSLVAPSPIAQPNIVLILADDLGYGDISSFSDTPIVTPNINQLARQGVTLSQFCASGNICTPSRAGLLTGQYPVRLGLANQTIEPGDLHGIGQSVVTLPELLQSQGYRTALVGKWHLGSQPEHHPLEHGFDYFYGISYSNDEPDQPLIRGRQSVQDKIDPQALATLFVRESVSFIDNATKDKPFFLMLATTSPHKPLLPARSFEGVSQAGAYGDVVEELDWGVGLVREAISRNKLTDNTLVIFTSDNGPFPEGSAGGLRGHKNSSWDGGFRVPFIATWPGTLASGGHSTGISMNIDLLPTLIELSGGEIESGLEVDGKSISAMLQGSNRSPHRQLYFFADDKIAAVRTQRWKIVLRARYAGIQRWLPDHGVELLFDMESDMGESYSLAQHRPGIWKELLAIYRSGVSLLEQQ